MKTLNNLLLFLFGHSLIQVGVRSRMRHAGEEQVNMKMMLHTQPLSVPVCFPICMSALVLMFSVLPVGGLLRHCR